MPTPVIDLQRHLTIVGALRAGGEKPERGAGKRLECWRLTSPRRDLIDQAAQLYGGEVSPWQSPTGPEWQVYTEQPELPVYVLPRYFRPPHYELWEGATKHLRSCEGNDHLEELSGQPCLCQQEEARGLPVKCDLYTRLVVALPELNTVLGWKLTSTGATIAHELPGMMALVNAIAPGRDFVPARLRLDQRRGVKDGQVTRFVVPVVDLGVGYLALARGASDSGDVALAAPAGLVNPVERESLALNAATEPSPQGRPVAAEPEPEPAPQPPSPEPEPEPVAPRTYKATKAQKDLLNLLVGKLRPQVVTTEHIWKAVATRLRGERDVELMIGILGGRDHDEQLHWSPLRESLTRPEASKLIEWLKPLADELETAAAEPAPPAPAPASDVERISFGEPMTVTREVLGPEQTDSFLPEQEKPQAATVPFNEFPEGY